MESDTRLKTFRDLIQALRSADVANAREALKEFDDENGALNSALACKSAIEDDVADVVKLPDYVANAFEGRYDVSKLESRIAESSKFLLSSSSMKFQWFLEKLSLNFNHSSAIWALLVDVLDEIPDCGSKLNPILRRLTAQKLETALKAIATHSISVDAIHRILGEGELKDVESVLFALNLTEEARIKFVCYLSRVSESKTLLKMLKRSLKIWGDPIIARGYVQREVVQCTKLALALLSHCDPDSIVASEMDVAELLVTGLPNHFNSTDGRIVQLAKFFSEVVTETMKRFKDAEHVINVDIGDFELGLEALKAVHECDKTKTFPFQAPLRKSFDKMTLDEDVKRAEVAENDSDDDESDLEPIETMDVAKKASSVTYLRHFLEKFVEMENFDDVKDAFCAVPGLVKHQLALEHAEIGENLLDLIFMWENQFENAELDEARKASLESIVVTRPEGNVRHLCRLFHREHVQPYRKNLVFEVLTRAAPKWSLVDLRDATQDVFRLLVPHPSIINDQDLIVRIPFIAFLSNLIRSNPDTMVEERHVVDFLNAVTRLRNADGATEQTVCYAVAQVMKHVGDRELLKSADVKDGIAETRDWILAVRSNRE